MISRHIDIVAVAVLIVAILILSEARKSIWIQAITNPARHGVQHMYIEVPQPPAPPVIFN